MSTDTLALISEHVARTFFAGRDPLGQSLAAIPAEGDLRQSPASIIGVVGDALVSPFWAEEYGTIYRPLDAERSNPPGLLVRTARPGAVVGAIGRALRRIDDRVNPTFLPVRGGIDQFLLGHQRLAWTLVPSATLALLLAALGVYGVTMFVVGQRMEEISVRLALGASPPSVRRVLVVDSLRPVAIGLVVGLAAALAAGRILMQQQLPGISPHDPLWIAVALLTLLACAFLAVLLPARRAAMSDPATLLRRT